MSSRALAVSKLRFLLHFNLLISFLVSAVSLFVGTWLSFYVLKINKNYDDFCSSPLESNNNQFIPEPIIEFEKQQIHMEMMCLPDICPCDSENN